VAEMEINIEKMAIKAHYEVTWKSNKQVEKHFKIDLIRLGREV